MEVMKLMRNCFVRWGIELIGVFVVVFQLGCIASLGYSLTHPCSVTCLLAALLV